jgi:hypothetical protein
MIDSYWSTEYLRTGTPYGELVDVLRCCAECSNERAAVAAS